MDAQLPAQYIIPAGTQCSVSPDYARRKYSSWVAPQDTIFRAHQIRRYVPGVFVVEHDDLVLVVREECLKG